MDVARCGYPHAATLLPLPSGSACTATSCSIPDSDGDGLNDAWEIQGGIDLDCDGEIDPARDLRLRDADPHRPDVYLEYDYMVLPDQGTACAATAECSAGQSCVEGVCRGHSHRPQRAAIQAVVDAFARKGIALHVDRGKALPHSTVVTLSHEPPSCTGDDAVYLSDLKTRFFDARRTLAYHYAVFGHYDTCDSIEHCSLCPPEGGTPVSFGSGGRSELPGNDLYVTTGAILDAGITPGIEHEAGLLLHELGHNLRLRHAGDYDVPDFKPNYLSAMNFNFLYAGIPIAAVPGSTTPIACRVTADCPPETICATLSRTCVRIDYSGQALPDLDEHSLDESSGIAAGTNDITTYNCPDLTPVPGAGTGPIDWNCNGNATESNVTVDVNADGLVGVPPPLAGDSPLLTGYADWPNVFLEFQCTPHGSANAPPPGTLTRELTVPEAMRKHLLIARRSVEVREVEGGPTGEQSIAIMGADDLDVADIDGSSLKLARRRPERTGRADVNGDGRADLVLTFDRDGLAPGTDRRPLRLSGWLKNSQAFDGEVRR